MIKPGKHNVTAVLLSTMLFLTFTMMHEFDFLLPPSPVATATSSAPAPDIAEETGSEDEIEHDDSYIIVPMLDKRATDLGYRIYGLYIARVLTPPPDLS